MALRAEKIHCPRRFIAPCQHRSNAARLSRHDTALQHPRGNASVSICCVGADNPACAVITRLVSARLWVRLVLTGDSPNSCSVFPQKWKPKPHYPLYPPPLFISQVSFRKHAVGLFERILWVFLVPFLISFGNPSALAPTKHPTVTQLSVGNPGTLQKPFKAHFCVSKVVLWKEDETTLRPSRHTA